MNVTNISGNLYLNMFVLYMVEIPGNIFSLKLADTRVGRRLTVGGMLFVAGLSLLLVAAVPKGERSILIFRGDLICKKS